MWTAANFIIEGRIWPYGRSLYTVVLKPCLLGHNICIRVSACTTRRLLWDSL